MTATEYDTAALAELLHQIHQAREELEPEALGLVVAQLVALHAYDESHPETIMH